MEEWEEREDRKKKEGGRERKREEGKEKRRKEVGKERRRERGKLSSDMYWINKAILLTLSFSLTSTTYTHLLTSTTYTHLATYGPTTG